MFTRRLWLLAGPAIIAVATGCGVQAAPPTRDTTLDALARRYEAHLAPLAGNAPTPDVALAQLEGQLRATPLVVVSVKVSQGDDREVKSRLFIPVVGDMMNPADAVRFTFARIDGRVVDVVAHGDRLTAEASLRPLDVAAPARLGETSALWLVRRGANDLFDHLDRGEAPTNAPPAPRAGTNERVVAAGDPAWLLHLASDDAQVELLVDEKTLLPMLRIERVAGHVRVLERYEICRYDHDVMTLGCVY
jgi:hypothetical protein